MPKVSVIIPVYKAEKLLRSCIDSAVSQTYADIEIVLVDDGSPDKSGEICDEYAAADPRVHVLHQPNSGVSAARNAGIGIAKGDFILFLDSDDYLDKDACKKMIGVLLNSGADIAGFSHFNVKPGGETEKIPFFLPPGAYEREDIMDKIVRPMLAERTRADALNGFVWRYIFKREFVVGNGISFSGAYLEDELFLLEYLCCSKKLVVVPEYLYYYLDNPASVTKLYLKTFEKTFLDFFELKSRLIQKFDIKGIDGWENSTLWSGIIIAVGNEYAPGNAVPLSMKRKNIKALCEREPFRTAIASVKPTDAGKRKQIVIDLIYSKRYTLLTLLYMLKNSGR